MQLTTAAARARAPAGGAAAPVARAQLTRPIAPSHNGARRALASQPVILNGGIGHAAAGVSRLQVASATSSGSGGPMAQMVEYIWCDGHEGAEEKGLLFNEMRSKTKVLQDPIEVGGSFPDWSYDGSSTGQAQGNDSDCILRACFSCPDPIRGGNSVLVMCEVMMPDGVTPHPSNNRAKLAQLVKQNQAVVDKEEPWYGFEQEYTMMAKGGHKVYGWPDAGAYPAPQGPFYCGVGLEEVYGRPLVEEHMEKCLEAGLKLSGVNAEVMPGQWEFQVGPVGPLEVGDETMVARWLLNRLGEEYDAVITLAPKPVKGDWNGTGAHTNFSTNSMRSPGGREVINEACDRLAATHDKHVAQYGRDNELRLTGKHETCDIHTFRAGVADRGASIRIPRLVEQVGYGYLEDRRPGANVDPYVVSRLLLATCLGLEDVEEATAGASANNVAASA